MSSFLLILWAGLILQNRDFKRPGLQSKPIAQFWQGKLEDTGNIHLKTL